MSVSLLGLVLHSQSAIFRELEATLLSFEWMLLVILAIWCGCFIFLTFSPNDLPLIGLLLITITMYFIGEAASWKISDAIIFFAGMTLGRGTQFLLKSDGRWKMENRENNSESGNTITDIVNRKSPIENFSVGLVVLLAFSSWWHLDMAYAYHGPRWMGLWDNPNIYGILMGAGGVLAVGLLVGECRRRGDEFHFKNVEIGNRKSVRDSSRRLLRVFIFIAAGMMGVGLVMSYSRGAWLATAVGLLYLAWSYGKLKWRVVLPFMLAAATVVIVFWHATADTDPWYLKRLDFSRPSAQHRVSAWRGAVQMMQDHPFGVGWNKAVETYDKNYSPPEGGAAAITMNSYLMLGTELGLPGLVCFVAYVGLCYRKSPRPRLIEIGNRISEIGYQTACLAGALVFVVAFWFDGGLFTLATASVFWILLELGKQSSV